MFVFLHPNPDGSVSDVRIQAKNLSEAFQAYQATWWQPSMDGAVGVWLDAALVARIIPFTNRQTGDTDPHLQLWR